MIGTMKEELERESATFGLLGRLLVEEVSEEQLTCLAEENVFEESPLLHPSKTFTRGLSTMREWMRSYPASSRADACHDLGNDYLSLFIGVPAPLAPPWESSYFNDKGMTFQDEMLEVRACYKRFGVRNGKMNTEPDDHVGLELMFLAHVAYEAARALGEDDKASAEHALDAYRGFLADHALCWMPAWAGFTNEFARSEFYRGISLMVRGALESVADGLAVAPRRNPVRSLDRAARRRSAKRIQP